MSGRHPQPPRTVGPHRESSDALELEPVQDVAGIAAEWDALALASRNIFATREFLELWRHHAGLDRKLLVSICREPSSGRAVGILPLYQWRRFPLSVIRFLGHGAGDELGPICAPQDAPRVARMLRDALTEEDPHLFLGERLGPGSVEALRGARTLTSEGNPIIPLGYADWDAYLASRSSNFRQQLRRRERMLEQRHALGYRSLAPDGFERDFGQLLSLHASRWGPRTSFQADIGLHRDFARVALERGWLRLWFMELEGRPVAAWYGFRFAGVMSYYQAGRDPAWEDASVGLVLLAHTVREAIRERADEYKLLRGAEAYKYRFTDDDARLETLIVSRGAAAAVAVRAVELARTLRRRARATVGRAT